MKKSKEMVFFFLLMCYNEVVDLYDKYKTKLYPKFLIYLKFKALFRNFF